MIPEQHQTPQLDVETLFKNRQPSAREIAAVMHYYPPEGWPRQNARVAELWAQLRKRDDHGVGLLVEILSNVDLLAPPRPPRRNAASELLGNYLDFKHEGIHCERYNTIMEIVGYLGTLGRAAIPAIPALLSCVNVWYSHGTDDPPEYACGRICALVSGLGPDCARTVIPLAKKQLVGQLDPEISRPLIRLIDGYGEPDIVVLDWSSPQALTESSESLLRDLGRKARRLLGQQE